MLTPSRGFHNTPCCQGELAFFIHLWQSAERFDPKVASERSFVAMIARRRLTDRLRHDHSGFGTTSAEIKRSDPVDPYVRGNQEI